MDVCAFLYHTLLSFDLGQTRRLSESPPSSKALRCLCHIRASWTTMTQILTTLIRRGFVVTHTVLKTADDANYPKKKNQLDLKFWKRSQDVRVEYSLRF